jgi:hypothetical protein
MCIGICGKASSKDTTRETRRRLENYIRIFFNPLLFASCTDTEPEVKIPLGRLDIDWKIILEFFVILFYLQAVQIL